MASKYCCGYGGKKVGAMSTGEVVGIAAAGLVGLYLIMKKPATATAPVYVTAPPSSSASTTNTIVNDASSVINSFINAIS